MGITASTQRKSFTVPLIVRSSSYQHVIYQPEAEPQLDTEIVLLEVLGNSLSIADRIIHTKAAMIQFGLDSEVYAKK